jgi:hypothetical protein
MVEALSIVVVGTAGAYLAVLGLGAIVVPKRAARFLLGFASTQALHFFEILFRLIVGHHSLLPLQAFHPLCRLRCLAGCCSVHLLFFSLSLGAGISSSQARRFPQQAGTLGLSASFRWWSGVLFWWQFFVGSPPNFSLQRTAFGRR